MKTLERERLELIDAVVAETELSGITAGLLEKDEHLTDALKALFALPLDGVRLVLCGGTSLSKAHGLIERMSEDADLKIVLSPETDQLSRNQLRARLSDLRATLSQALTNIGLVEDVPQGRALNENRYFCSEWAYARRYDSVAGLRPKLQVEYTVRKPALPCVSCGIGSLADRLVGRNADVTAVPTVTVAETVAEKVLSFLRRFAQHKAGLLGRAWDTALVRHIYDVYCADASHPDIAAQAAAVFAPLVSGDQTEFGRPFPDFAATPLPVLSGALAQVVADTQIRGEYTRNLLPLVYGNVRPGFDEAFGRFEGVANALLTSLRQ